VDSKAECLPLNLANVARKKRKTKKLKQTNASAHLVQNTFKILEVNPEGTFYSNKQHFAGVVPG